MNKMRMGAAGAVAAMTMACGAAHGQFCGYQVDPVAPGATFNNFVMGMNVLSVTGTPELYLGGRFTQVGTSTFPGVVRYNGTTFNGLSGGLGLIDLGFFTQQGAAITFSAFDPNGSGNQLFMGGHYATTQDTSDPPVGDLNASVSFWNPMSMVFAGMGGVLDPNFSFAHVFDSRTISTSATTQMLVMVGTFKTADFLAPTPVESNGVIGYTQSGWVAMGGVSSDRDNDPMTTDETADARALHVHGGSQRLFMGGFFTHAGGVKCDAIARWNQLTNSWEALPGGGLPTVDIQNRYAIVHDMITFNGDLIVAGEFDTAGDAGVPAKNIARWDGSAWHSLGTGTNGAIYALGVYADESGEQALYAGGQFTDAGGVACTNLAIWNGTSWATSERVDGVNARILCMTEYANGLIIGGEFQMVNSDTSLANVFRLTLAECCPADHDGNGSVEVADIFAFLNDWFADFGTTSCDDGCAADFDGNGSVEVADIFAFLNEWFSAFPDGCSP